jgi:hypothetical protein
VTPLERIRERAEQILDMFQAIEMTFFQTPTGANKWGVMKANVESSLVACRAEALEDAAKVVEEYDGSGNLIDSIRSLGATKEEKF